MKKILSIILFEFLLYGCVNNISKYESVSIIEVIDITEVEFCDTLRYFNDVPVMLKKANIDTTTANYSSVIIRYALLSDLYSDKETTIKLDSVSSGFIDGVNEYDRIDEIKAFQKKARTSLNSLFKGVECKKDKSKVYETLCRSLQQLANDNVSRRILIIYSDMLQNSSLFSFYGESYEKQISDMIMHIDKTEKHLSESCGCSLPDLNNIEIIVVNRHIIQDDDRVELAERLWKALFKYKNVGKISFSSHLE
jgi:PBP1b-binding outer membrane lipoprotein LpoB